MQDELAKLVYVCAYGDYVELEIDENGIITNWPKRPDISAFFGGDDD